MPAQKVQWPGNGHYYEAFYVPDGITWDQANAAAAQAGGYLATITSSEENKAIYNLIADDDRFWFMDGGFGIGPLIGGLQTGSDEPRGGWSWVNGEPMNYVNWGSNQPDNSNWKEDRLHFFGFGILRDSVWNDLPRDFKTKGYIVEWEGTSGNTGGSAGLPTSDDISGYTGGPHTPTGGVMGNVVLFENIDYGGRTKVFSGDTPWIGDDFNDIASSLKIPPGYCVILYEDINYGGRSKQFCQNTPWVNYDFNDIVSSFRLVPADKPSPANPQVVLYEDTDYGGRIKVFEGDTPGVSPDFNDIASSLKIPPGYCVILYEDINYGGRSRQFCQNTPWVDYDFNDIASSFRLVRADQRAKVRNNLIAPTTSSSQTSFGRTSEESTYTNPYGNDIYGFTGGSSNTGITMGTPSSGMIPSGGCYQDPFTGEMICD